LKKAVGIIPVRYQSERFPGKPLALINGKPMIQRIYESAAKATLLDQLIVATDDKRISDVAKSFGADVRMTSLQHNSGTDRVAEVAKEIKTPIIINIQGDEPLLREEMIDDLVNALQDEAIPMATLAARVLDLNLLEDSNTIKVITDKDGYALYFSRSPLPFKASDYFLQHIGIYGYQREFLVAFSQMEQTRLEKAEKLEQLRALENGFRIKIIETPFLTIGVDSPQDIIKVEDYLKEHSYD